MRNVRLGLALFLLMGGTTGPAYADPQNPIYPQKNGTLYARLVNEIESGKTDADFKALRMAYLATGEGGNALRTAFDRYAELSKIADSQNFMLLEEKARQYLATDYTDIIGHKFLSLACEKLGKMACAEHHGRVKTGLLHSIMEGHNAQSCADAPEVAAIDEEYVVLMAVQRHPQRQQIVSEDGHLCDKIHYSDKEGREGDMYFNVGALLKAE